MISLKEEGIEKLLLLKQKLEIATLGLWCVIELVCTHDWMCGRTDTHFGTLKEITQNVKTDKDLIRRLADTYHNYSVNVLLLGSDGKEYPTLARELTLIIEDAAGIPREDEEWEESLLHTAM